MPKYTIYIISCLLVVSPTLMAYYNQTLGVNTILPTALIYLLGLGLMIYSYYGIITNQKQQLSKPELYKLIGGVFFLFLLMPPVLSKDVYLYLLQGKLALDGVFTYTNGELNSLHPFVENIDKGWIGCPNHYGPAAMGVFVPAAYFGSISAISNVISIKVFNLLIALMITWLVQKITLRDQEINRQTFLLFIVLNPVFLIQGIGQMHVDFLLLLFAFGLIYGLKYRNWILAGVCVGLMGATKFLLVVIFGGILVLFMLYEWLNGRIKIKQKILGFCSIIMALAVTYFFVWENAETILYPLAYHEDREPVHTMIELLSYAAVYFQDIPMQSSLTEYNDSIMALKVSSSIWISSVFRVIALVLALPFAFRVINAKSDNDFMFKVGILLMIVFLVYSPHMHAWYFLLILPFLAFGLKLRYVLIYAAITLGISNAYEISSILDTKTIESNIIMITFSIISVITYYLYAHIFYHPKSIREDIACVWGQVFNKKKY